MKIEIKKVNNGYLIKKTYMVPKDLNPYPGLAMPSNYRMPLEENITETVFEKWSDVQLHIRKEFGVTE